MNGVGVSRQAAKLSSAPLPDFVEPMKAQLVDRSDPATGFMKSNSTVAALWRFAAAVKASPIAEPEGSREEVHKRKRIDCCARRLGCKLCRIPFYAAPSTDFPLARRSPVRHKKVLLVILVRVP